MSTSTGLSHIDIEGMTTAQGPFPSATRAGDFVFVSGQVSKDENKVLVGEGDIYAQTVQTQQRAATRPLGVDTVEGDRPARARAQPGSDFFRVAFGQRQDLAGDAQHHRHAHQQTGHDIPRTTARKSQTAAQRSRHLGGAGSGER
jgi:hypothetical protein